MKEQIKQLIEASKERDKILLEQKERLRGKYKNYN